MRTGLFFFIKIKNTSKCANVQLKSVLKFNNNENMTTVNEVLGVEDHSDVSVCLCVCLYWHYLPSAPLQCCETLR